ncbi:MAG TPA: hypothetical protein VFV38_07570 [Ktedonobacteraceae bacterium]|nr:hypothetical protein [Ktedonobacteraceae bacterium]
MYDDVELEPQWFEDIHSLTLIKYPPKRKGITPAYQFVIHFKNNNSWALRKARDLVLEVLNYDDVEEFRRGYLVTIPGHEAGSINRPCEYLCAEMAKAYPRQLVHLRQALQRTITVAKSATAYYGQRPTYTDHFRSIRYAGPQLDSNERIIMVDDVLTRGETSRACRDILRKATGCTDVQGLFVARTTYQ